MNDLDKDTQRVSATSEVASNKQRVGLLLSYVSNRSIFHKANHSMKNTNYFINGVIQPVNQIFLGNLLDRAAKMAKPVYYYNHYNH